MKINVFRTTQLFLILLFAGTSIYCQPSNLKCEYLVNPIGLDEPHPRFTWQLNDKRQGASQNAYRIYLGTVPVLLTQSPDNIWESGKINSDKMLTSYDGPALKPFTKYFWSVEVWDKEGNKSPLASLASFETGMMDIKNWKGTWITDTLDFNYRPAPYFRKVFETKKKIISARAYIAVAGLYELYLNGKKVGDHKLDPIYTRFDRRTFYLTYDVTQMLLSGKNAIGILLGNGWYNHQPKAVWDFEVAPWRARPKFCMDLRITYDDGSVETITSGPDWKRSLSPVTFNSIYVGEHYDARLEQPGWNTVNFDDSKWKKVKYSSAPSSNIISQSLHPIRNVEEIPAKSMKKINDFTYLFDLGRNISGVSSIKLKGEAGTTVSLMHAERLDSVGRADQSNIIGLYTPTVTGEPFQTDIYTLNGKDEETFMPHFNYKGFQYVEVTSDKPIELTKESLTGYFMHSDVPDAGSIDFSNHMMNKLNNATRSSYLSNLFGYFTDCPQREKNGWTGDAHIAVETGLYNFDGITIYEKWLADHRDEQQPNGALPAIIPTGGWGYQWANGPDWTSTIAIIPWNIYLFYGDSHLLLQCYDNIKRYVDLINEKSPTGLTDWGLGDWSPVKSEAPMELTSNCYYYTDAMILAKAAKLFGNMPDYEKYSALADKIKNAFNAKYLNSKTGIYNNGLQTELSAPLFWGLVPDELKTKVADNLAKRVKADNNHIDVGLLGSKAILNALSENGYPDLAYTLVSQEDYPSWGWWIANGATTLYEGWSTEKKRSYYSYNHIMFGEIGAWFYKGLGGIYPDENEPGFKNIILKPNFVKGLDHFEAKHDGPYGAIVSSWKRSKKTILYSVTIPANSKAILYLNAKKIIQNSKDITNKQQPVTTIPLESGSYLFSITQ